MILYAILLVITLSQGWANYGPLGFLFRLVCLIHVSSHEVEGQGTQCEVTLIMYSVTMADPMTH